MKSTLKELELTRIEMSQSTAAVEEQAKNSIAQKFDNNFYSLLENQSKVIDKIVSENVYMKSAVGGGQVERIDKYLVKEILGRFKPYQDDIKESLDTWLTHKDVFLPFFLVNFQILSYIDKNNVIVLNDDEAKQYSNVLRSLIPNEFLCLLFLNVTAERFAKYKRLLEKYEFFEHMNLEPIRFEMFVELVKRIDIDVFGDKRRFKNYLEKCIERKKVSLFIMKNSYVNIFGIKPDLMPKVYRDDAEKLLIKLESYLYGLNVFHLAEDKETFGKFVNKDFLFFIEKKPLLNDELTSFKARFKVFLNK